MAKEDSEKYNARVIGQPESEAHGHWMVLKADTQGIGVTPQGHLNIPGINDQTAATTQIAANLIAMEPGGKAKGHVHPEHETIIWVVYGHAVTLMGPDQTQTFQGPGDWLFIGKGVDHLPANLSEDEPVFAVVLRADPEFIERLEMRPYVDAVAKRVLPGLRAQFAAGTLPQDWQKHALSIEPLLMQYRQTILDLKQAKP